MIYVDTLQQTLDQLLVFEVKFLIVNGALNDAAQVTLRAVGRGRDQETDVQLRERGHGVEREVEGVAGKPARKNACVRAHDANREKADPDDDSDDPKADVLRGPHAEAHLVG